MPSVQMRQFRHLVFTRPEVRAALHACASDPELVVATVALASEFGIVLAEEDVRLALNAGKREWIERWT